MPLVRRKSLDAVISATSKATEPGLTHQWKSWLQTKKRTSLTQLEQDDELLDHPAELISPSTSTDTSDTNLAFALDLHNRIFPYQHTTEDVEISVKRSIFHWSRFQLGQIEVRAGQTGAFILQTRSKRNSVSDDQKQFYMLHPDTCMDLKPPSMNRKEAELVIKIPIISTSGGSLKYRTEIKLRFAKLEAATYWLHVIQDTIACLEWFKNVQVRNEQPVLSTPNSKIQHVQSMTNSEARDAVVKVIANARIAKQDNAEITAVQKLIAVNSDVVARYTLVETRDDVQIMMPKFASMNLSQYLRNEARANRSKWAKASILSISDVKQIVSSLCDQLSELHFQEFLHCDVKLENVLVSPSPNGLTVKLIDFGAASELHKNTGSKSATSRTSFMMGTPGYVAPERISDPFEEQKLTCKVDTFSLGIILVQLLINQHPFHKTPGADQIRHSSHAISHPRRQRLKLKDSLQSLHWDWIELEMEKRGIPDIPNAMELLQGMLARHPSNRLSITQVGHHAWF